MYIDNKLWIEQFSIDEEQPLDISMPESKVCVKDVILFILNVNFHEIISTSIVMRSLWTEKYLFIAYLPKILNYVVIISQQLV